MIRIAGMLLIAMIFSFYVFGHGTCSSIDTVVAKCKTSSLITEPYSEVPHASQNGNAETSVHVCGCVNTFVVVISPIEFGSFPETLYGALKLNFASSEFSQRIERPPIVPT